MIALELPPALEKRLTQGHPWVYRNHVPSGPSFDSGTWLRLRCGSFSGYGLWDSKGSIAIRIFSQRQVPDAPWIADRVAEAFQIRSPVRRTNTSGYRWVFGESDGLPGIVVDLYRDFAVIRTYAESVQNLVRPVADALHAHTLLHGVLHRAPGQEPEIIWGQPPPGDLTVEENGLLFRADLLAGQKTGLYFDQRDNRRVLAGWCRDRSVLDCFCYTGAFALYAARAGASSVTASDAAREAVEAAKRNFALNSIDPSQHGFLVRDSFELLEDLAKEGRRFDVVIVDPPSFARDRKSRHAALRAYLRLNQLAASCVEPGGILAAASCTSQVSPQAFRETLAEATRRAGRRLAILHDAGQPLDHPVPAGFPEARYLKFVIGRVLRYT